MTTTSPMARAPLIGQIRSASRAEIAQDVLAGTITAILLVPQALAYALLAGLPPAVGLYASILPPLVYAFTGTSRTLAVGPVAVAALMVSAALAPWAGADATRAIAGAAWIAMLSGALLVGMGALRLGWLTHFISHPVLTGFTTGSALLIVATQVGPLTGIALPRDAGAPAIAWAFLRRIGDLNPVSFAFGAVTLAALVASRSVLQGLLTRFGVGAARARVAGRVAPLLLVLAAIVVSASIDAHGAHGVATIGLIPKGLPLPDFAFVHEDGWRALVLPAALIAVIGYVESISVAKALAFRRRERIGPDQELLALGAANLAAACAGGMPVAGGFARSTVNFDAGARTQLAAIVTATWVATVALFFTGMLRALPNAVLAAIIVVAVWQLVDLRGVAKTFAYDRADGAAQALTILGVLSIGVENGLLLGVSLAAGLFLFRTSRPHIAVTGRVPGTEHFRNVKRHDVETWPHLAVIRVDENLYFANSPRVESELHRIVLDHDGLSDVILVMSGVAYIDASALEMLDNFEEALCAGGVGLRLAEVKGPVMDRLRGSALAQRLGTDRIHLTTQQAVAATGACPT